MSWVTGCKCDGCGIQKQASNHWFVLLVGAQSVTLDKWLADLPGEHYCGTDCLFKRLAQWAE